IVVPKWPSQPWWQSLIKLASRFVKLGKSIDVLTIGGRMRKQQSIFLQEKYSQLDQRQQRRGALQMNLAKEVVLCECHHDMNLNETIREKQTNVE
ncbi:MAG: hypothetical protein EZS28_053646, partial [Streblomastix strix]